MYLKKNCNFLIYYIHLILSTVFLIIFHRITQKNTEVIEKQIGSLDRYCSIFYRPPFPENQFDFPVQHCISHYLKAFIAPDGFLYICNQHRGNKTMVLGSIFEYDFWEIWNSNLHIEISKKINPNNCPPCRHVAYNHLINRLHNQYIPDVMVDPKV